MTAVCFCKPEVVICILCIKVFRRKFAYTRVERKTANINAKTYQFTMLFKDDTGTLAQLKQQI